MPDNNIIQTASNFFFVFARMEFALKVNGYHRGEGKAIVDWDRYARDISNIFINPINREFNQAISYYETHPPKVQMVRGNNLVWEDQILHSNSKSVDILKYIRRVRNNLFHGGKFRGVEFDNPHRSELLMNYALVILESCRNSSPNINEAYNSQ